VPAESQLTLAETCGRGAEQLPRFVDPEGRKMSNGDEKQYAALGAARRKVLALKGARLTVLFTQAAGPVRAMLADQGQIVRGRARERGSLDQASSGNWRSDRMPQ
jgi:hypothetical protein